MKGKRHTTEDKIRILREADGGRSIRIFSSVLKRFACIVWVLSY
jgi:hypothetical protein